jgi:hypothetical protein
VGYSAPQGQDQLQAVQRNQTLTVRAHAAPALLLWAMAALGVGALVYVLDRDPHHVWLMPAAWSLPQWRGLLPRAISDSLPSFVHVFAFALLSAWLWARTRQQAIVVVFAWWLLDLVFELAQLGAVRAQLQGHVWLQHWPQGDFDGADVLALSIGAVVAGALLWRSRQFHQGDHT